MSLEEVREATDAPAGAAPTEEKPKATRRRTTKKADEAVEVAAAPTDEEKPKVTRRRTTKKADETPAAEAVESVEAAPAPKPKVTRRKKTDAEAPVEAVAPAAPAPVSAAEPVTQPVSAPVAAPAPEVAQPQLVFDSAPAPTLPIPTPEPVQNFEAPRAAENQLASESAAQQAQNAFNPAGEGNTAAPFNREEGGYNQDGYGREEGGFNRRMSYRDRRNMRRDQRIAARQQRFTENGGEGAAPVDGNRPMQENRPVQENAPNGGPNNFRGNGNNRPNNFNQPQQQQQPRRREYDLLTLEALEPTELVAVAQEFGLETLPTERLELHYAILEAQARTQNALLKKGVLEIASDGRGFLRCEGYRPADGDVYVSQTQIKRFNLKTGDMVLGAVRSPKENERFHGLLRVEAINDTAPELLRTRRDFEKLTPIFPTDRYVLETHAGNITARIIDLVSPIGKGQRGLIVAPPKAGKTTLIKNIANSMMENNPEAVLFVLLIDERPEEVTDISRSVRGEVVASTFDEVPENHMRVADIVFERAKRLVEAGKDVVVLLDSITRLSRASNLVVSPSGRTLSGGLDPAAMYRPKRMFGAARNIEEGGSLTILATALVDTGSRMDEMIFEEFKGTGNMDLVLDRSLFDQRIFPAIDINRSGTRRDDLLMSKEDLAATYHLRRTLAQLDNDKAVNLLIDRLKNTKSNEHFMEVVAKSARQAGQTATPPSPAN